MNTVKFKTVGGKHYAWLGFTLLDGNEIFLKYRGKVLHDLPTTFGSIEDPQSKSEGTDHWFNHGGLTYMLD